jgi:hypothetical protein
MAKVCHQKNTKGISLMKNNLFSKSNYNKGHARCPELGTLFGILEQQATFLDLQQYASSKTFNF